MQFQALPTPVTAAGQAEANFTVPRTGASSSELQQASAARAKSGEFPSDPRSFNSQASSLGSQHRENSSQSLTVKVTDDSDPRSSNIMPTLEEEPSEVGRTKTGLSGFAHGSLGSFSPRLSKLIRYRKFVLLRLLAGLSPLIIFTLLCAGYGGKTMTTFSAGASAFLVLWFISLTKAPRKIVYEDQLTTDLFEFSDQASNANHADFKDLLAKATDDELDALCVLVELTLPWRSKSNGGIERSNSKNMSRGIFSRKSYSWGDSAGSVVAVAQNIIPTLSRKSGSMESSPNSPAKTPPTTPKVDRVARTWSNLSANSRKVKFGNNVQAGNTESTDHPRSILKTRASAESFDSHLLRPSFSEISLSSFSDFQRKNEPASGAPNFGTQLALELDLPAALSEFQPEGAEQKPQSSEGAEQKPQSSRHRFRMLGGGGSFLGVDNLHSLQSEAPSNSSALTYHSACDAVLGDVDKPTGELVSAEIAGVGPGSNGMTRVRIEFRSQCLRTQNEWQKSLLQQQKTLLKAVNTKLKKTQQELSHVKTWADDMHEDQKVLLRSFRKIIPREIGDLDEMDEIKERVVVIIIDEDESIRTSSQKMCQDLEYRCFAFREVQKAYDIVQRLLMPSSPGGESPRQPRQRISRSSSVVELGAPSQNALPLILFGVSMLDKMPSEWQDSRFFLALTSHAEDFEDVGRRLLASSETEIRERLRSKGISEYLFHPLSMNAMRGTVRKMVREKLGNEYLLVDTLGRGAFGVVYRAKRLRDGEVFALKEISLRRQAKMAKQEANIEPTMLKSLSWPTVVGLVDEWISRKDQVQYLLMTVLLGGNVYQQIELAKEKDLIISPDRWLEWYAQTLHALCYLHWKGVLHRDIKPANLFLAADFRALLVGDLGSAARLPGAGPHPSPHSKVPGVVTTVAYSSPEVFVSKVFYAASDLWSLGVSFFQVLTLKYPHTLPEFADQDPNLVDPNALGVNAHTVLQETKISGPDEEKVTQELLQMLRIDPLERPSATSLAAQPYIKQCLEPVLALPDHPSKQYFTTPEKHLAVFDRLLLESRIADVNSFRPSTKNIKSGSSGGSSEFMQVSGSHDCVKI